MSSCDLLKGSTLSTLDGLYEPTKDQYIWRKTEPAKNSMLRSMEVPFLLQGLSIIVPPGRMIRVSFR
ncbi:hypothetical protein VNO77_42051 [Canavalia gladiata]|uniref:Uncharacterized protein n=1 Tax=Canavalia gladiata TaxID=3824 RepID=A0AAN9K216_CANGL